MLYAVGRWVVFDTRLVGRIAQTRSATIKSSVTSRHRLQAIGSDARDADKLIGRHQLCCIQWATLRWRYK